jgi:hypothetical protein
MAQPKREPDAPYVPSTEEAVAGMLRLANVTMTDIVYDSRLRVQYGGCLLWRRLIPGL